MANHKIFIGNYGVVRNRVGDSRSTDYSYSPDKQLLELYWRGELVKQVSRVFPGDAFIVTCDGEEPQISEMHFPKHPNDYLMYILGFGSGLRCHRRDFYKKALGAQRMTKLTNGRTEREFKGEHYIFNVCEDSAGKPYHLAAIIDADLSAKDYTKILREWPYQIRYPQDFLQIAFANIFGMNEKEISTVFEAWG